MPRAQRTQAEFAEWFWSQVDRSAGPDACWPWIGHRYAKQWAGNTATERYGLVERRERRRDRHGVVRTVRVTHNASKVAHELATGKRVGPGKKVCHHCDHPWCCNGFKHTWEGSHQDNMDDMVRKGRGNGPRLFGEAHPGVRFSAATILKVKRMAAAGSTAKQIAEETGMSIFYVRDVVNGKRRVHG